MGVRKLEDAPEYLAQFALGQAAGLAGCRISEALRHLKDEEKQRALEAIPKLLAHLRSGKARKKGEVSALKRIMIVVQSIQERTKEVQQMIDDLQSLQKLLNPEAILGDVVEWAVSEVEGKITKVANDKLGNASCQLVEAGIKTAASLAPAAQAMEQARNAAETIRQVKLLWNSNIDLMSLLDFSLIQDQLIDELEDRLCALVSQSADVGAEKAEAFLKQKLNPEDWIKTLKSGGSK